MITVFNDDFFIGHDKSPKVDLVIADPPYGLNYKEWDKINFAEFTESWINICLDRLKPNGQMWIFMAKDNLFTHEFCEKGLINILQGKGIVNLKNWCVWARNKGRGSSKHLKSLREEVIHFSKTNTYTWNEIKMLREVVCPYVKDGKPRGWFLDENGKRVRWTGLGNVWVYSAPQWNGVLDKQIHPSQKPIMLIERLIRLSSNKNDVILDPFGGSLSTVMACLNSDRSCVAFEKDTRYFNDGMERVKKHEKYK